MAGPTKVDEHWFIRFHRAKTAREQGQKAREGRPPANPSPGRLRLWIMTAPASGRTPLYEAHHAPRYERQALIRHYQETHSCRLVVMVDHLFSHSVTLFEETLDDACSDNKFQLDDNDPRHARHYTLAGHK